MGLITIYHKYYRKYSNFSCSFIIFATVLQHFQSFNYTIFLKRMVIING